MLAVEQSPDAPGKWLLEFEILETRNPDGPGFAQAGAGVKGFAFAKDWTARAGNTVTAEAEYLGGVEGWHFQLRHVEIVY